MERLPFFKFIITSFLLTICINLLPHSFEKDGIYYQLSPDKESVGVTYKGSNASSSAYAGDIKIPTEVEYEGKRYPVSSIKVSAFHDCTNLKSIYIPASIQNIGSFAFLGCNALKEIVFDAANCTDFSYFPPFFNLKNVTSIRIGTNVKRIPAYAFSGCISLSEIEIPKNVQSIGEAAFRGCRQLQKISFSENLHQIENYTFTNCTQLQSVQLPKGIQRIGKHAFSNCTQLKEISLADSLQIIDDFAFKNCGLENVSIPENVKVIGYQAFKNNCNLKEVHFLAQSCIRAGTPKGAAFSCDAFCNYGALSKIIIGEKVQRIPNSIFRNCIKIKELKIPHSVQSIGDSAFWGCFGLSSVELPSSIVELGNFSFAQCKNLRFVSLPDSLSKIGAQTFDGSIWLSDWINSQPDGLIYIGKSAFKYKGESADSIEIRQGTQNILARCFDSGRNIKQIQIPSSVQNIEQGALDSTSWYTAQPDGLVYAGNVAYKFKGKQGEQQQIKLKENTQGISNGCFDNCKNIQYIYYKDSIPPLIGDNTFTEEMLERVTLFVSPSALNTFRTQWKEFKHIESAFEKNDLWFRQVDSSHVAVMRPSAIDIQTINIPESISFNGNNFTVSAIDKNAFEQCVNLKNISIAATIDSIGNAAFDGCNSLQSIICQGKEPAFCTPTAFGKDERSRIRIYTRATLWVPARSVRMYNLMSIWKNFSIEPLPTISTKTQQIKRSNIQSL